MISGFLPVLSREGLKDLVAFFVRSFASVAQPHLWYIGKDVARAASEAFPTPFHTGI